QRARLEWLRCRDGEFEGWGEFDRALREASLAARKPGRDDLRPAARAMFFALHPRAVPALYGEPPPAAVAPAEYAGLLRAVLAHAGALGVPVARRTLLLGPLTAPPSPEWRVVWEAEAEQPRGTVVRVAGKSPPRVLHVALGRDSTFLGQFTLRLLS